MSQESDKPKPYVRRELQEHEQRITLNEQWRYQTQGALKLLAFIIGSGAAMTLLFFFLQ